MKYLIFAFLGLMLLNCSSETEMNEELVSEEGAEEESGEDVMEEPEVVETIDFDFVGSRNFGSAEDDYGHSFAFNGEDFIYAGQSNYRISVGSSDGILFATDSEFNKLWESIYPDAAFFDVINTSDGNFVAVGRIGFNANEFNDVGSTFVERSKILVVKFDKRGNEIWQFVVDAEEDSLGGSASSVLETKGGNYLVLGETPTNKDIFGDVAIVHLGLFALEIDTEGELIWANAYTEGYSSAKAVENSDNTYFVTNVGNAEILKIDLVGNLLDRKDFSGSGFQGFNSIEKLENGNFILAGQTNLSGESGGYDVWIVKLDSELNLIDEKTMGSSRNDYGRGIKGLADGGFMFIGLSGNDDGDVYGHSNLADWWIVKLSSDLEIVDQTSLGGLDLDECNEFILFEDKKEIVVFGETFSSGTSNITPRGGSDHWVMRLAY